MHTALVPLLAVAHLQGGYTPYPPTHARTHTCRQLAPLPAVAQRQELYRREAEATDAALEFEVAEQKVRAHKLTVFKLTVWARAGCARLQQLYRRMGSTTGVLRLMWHPEGGRWPSS